MSFTFPSYLHRNRHSIFGFRVVIPADLRQYFPIKEYRLSLRTASVCEAKPLALSLSHFVNTHFNRTRKLGGKGMESENSKFLELLTAEKNRLLHIEQSVDQMTREDIDEIIALAGQAIDKEVPGFSAALTEISRKQKAISSRRDALIATMQSATTLDDNDIDDAFDSLHLSLSELDQEQADLRNECDHFKAVTLRELSELRYLSGIRSIEESSIAERERIIDLAGSILRSSVTQVIPNQGVIDVKVGKNISQVIEEYCDEQVRAGNWTAKTLEENKAIYALWIRIVGDMPIAKYGHPEQRLYRHNISRLPSNINKDVRYRNKSIDDILALDPASASINTINKNLQRVSAFLSWAVSLGYLGLNPAAGQAIKSTKRANEERDVFGIDDLRKLFENPEFGSLQQSSYAYWTPLIALFSGARLNEIAQLYLSDFQNISGIDVISINESGDHKSIKTKSSKRLIPIHHELIRLGLLDHVHALREAKESRLFPDLQPTRDGFGQLVSKWFSRYRVRHGVADSGKVFHSFRHTVTDQLKQKGIAQERVSALLGHETTGETFGRYGKDFSPQMMLEVVNSLTYDLNLKPRKKKYQ